MRTICGTILAAILAAACCKGAVVCSEATAPTVSLKEYETEVCVVGGGMAGICASVAAARNGAKVVLVQDRPMLGGNASSEIRVPVSSAYGEPLPGGKVLENREGGIIEEIRLENIYRNPSCNWHVWDHVLWNFCAREPNLTVLLNTSVMECATNGNTIVSVAGWDSISYTRVTVRAKIFIDCSGDGILRLSGAAYMKGNGERVEWTTVKVVRDNCRRWLDLRFDTPISGDACRVVWVRPWGETTEQRVFSFEVY